MGYLSHWPISPHPRSGGAALVTDMDSQSNLALTGVSVDCPASWILNLHGFLHPLVGCPANRGQPFCCKPHSSKDNLLNLLLKGCPTLSLVLAASPDTS